MNIRNKNYSILVTAVCMAVVSFPGHARGFGGGGGFHGGSGSYSGSRGSASWGGGSGSASTTRGGSASWSNGSGSATSARGGDAAWSGGSGSAHSAYGNSASWSGGGAYHGGTTNVNSNVNVNSNRYYGGGGYGYRPPTYYNNGYSGGEVAAAGVAGLAVGAMAGAAAASSQAATPVYVQQPAYVAPPVNPNLIPIGTNLDNLPGGCANVNYSATQYYQCGANWFRTGYSNGVTYYQVVPAPY